MVLNLNSIRKSYRTNEGKVSVLNDVSLTLFGGETLALRGESGSGNLTLAMTLKAKSEKKLEIINDSYALCPYINGDYGNKEASLLSMYENDGYFISSNGLSIIAFIYDPKNKPKDNFLAWLY